MLSFACATLVFSAPASAQRSVVIDRASQSNTLASCGTDCFSLAAQSGQFRISANGSLQVLGGGDARFFAAESPTTFQVLSGYTFRNNQRVDFVDFFAQGRSLAINGFGNREAPDFQIQLQRINGGGVFPNLEIAFAYRTPVGPSEVPGGARIGYSGTLGQYAPEAPFFIAFGGRPIERFVTNTGGLLLGEQAGASDFSFLLGTVPDRNFNPVTTLVSESFNPRYLVAGDVPEPATWAMMIVGFGFVGAASRARRRRASLAAA